MVFFIIKSKMKYVLMLLCVCLFFGAKTSFAGIPTTCVNCSNFIQQMLDSITSSEQLAQIINQYNELIIQTEQQIALVQSEILRVQSLGVGELERFKGHMADLAKLTSDIRTYRGDITALADIFRNMYPDMDTLFGILDSNPNAIQEQWREQSKKQDEAIEATFQMSGQQLDSLVKNRAATEDYIDRLLKEETEVKIAQSANQLSKLQISELQELRTLMSTQIQAQAMQASQQSKQQQTQHKLWQEATKGFPLEKDERSRAPF